MSLERKGEPSEARRIVAILTVLGLLALGGVANSTIRHAHASLGAPPTSSVGYAVLSSGSTSVAWYCAGPLPIGARPQSSSIAIANVGTTAVSGQVKVVSSAGTTTNRPFQASGRAETVIGLARVGKPSFASATVLADAGSIGVEEVVHSPSGVSSTPCVTRTSAVQYLASGSTTWPADINLALYNPGATPAVASVSLIAGSSTVSPPSFQGIGVSPGGVVVLDVGRFVLNQPVVSTTVNSTGGRIIAGAMETALARKQLVSSIISGSATTSTRVMFPAAPAGGATRQIFDVYDPSSSVAHVAFRLVGTDGVANENLVVGAGTVARFTPAPDAQTGALRAATVTSLNKVGIVVARATVIDRDIIATVQRRIPASPGHPTRLLGPSPLASLPTLLPGFALTSGIDVADRRWVLPGGESDTKTGEFVVISNPGLRRATVKFITLGGGKAAAGAAIPGLTGLVVGPGATIVVNLGATVTSVVLPLEVSTSEPVVVGAALYARD